MRQRHRIRDCRSLEPKSTSRLWLLSLLALLVTSATVAWQAHLRFQDRLGFQNNVGSNILESATREISRHLEENQRRVRQFSAQYRTKLQSLAAEPENNPELYAHIDANLHTLFPDMLAFTVADEYGEPLLTSIQGLVRHICKNDIKRFVKNTFQHEIPVHPNPKAYHYDIMEPMPLSNEPVPKGVFFISFDAAEIGSMLGAHALPGYQLLLTRPHPSGMTEITTSTRKFNLTEKKILPWDELTDVQATEDLIATGWKIHVRRLPGLRAAARDEVLKHAMQTLALVFLFGGFLFAWLLKEHRKRKQAEERYQQLFTHNKSTELLIAPDTGSIIEANDAAARFYGYSVKQLQSMRLQDLDLLPDDIVEDNLQRALIDKREKAYYRHQLSDGDVRDVEMHSGSICHQGRSIVYAIIHDISERKKLEFHLHQSEQRFRQIFENNPQVAVIGLDRNHVIRYWNKASSGLFGYSPGTALGAKFETLLAPDAEHKRYSAQLERWFEEGPPAESSEQLFIRLGNQPVTVHSSHILFTTLDGDPEIYSLYVDITERLESHAAVSRMAFYDALTDLPNRRLLTERLQAVLSSTEQHFGALLFIDLDHFKPINDRYGHALGDRLLSSVAQRLAQAVEDEKTPLLARLGGDEFVLLLPDLGEDLDSATNRANDILIRIIKQVRRGFRLDELELRTTCSIGATMLPGDFKYTDDAINAADAAMYRAKNSGRNTFQFAARTTPADNADD